MKKLFFIFFILFACESDGDSSSENVEYTCNEEFYINGLLQEEPFNFESNSPINEENLIVFNRAISLFTVITPNGDGLNDVLVIEGVRDFDNNIFRVFDGDEKFYEMNNYGFTDNYFIGGGLNDGVYKYELEILYEGDIHLYKGNLLIITSLNGNNGEFLSDCNISDPNDPVLEGLDGVKVNNK